MEEIIIRVAVSHDEEGCHYYIYDGVKAVEATDALSETNGIDGGLCTSPTLEEAVAMAAEHAIEVIRRRA